MAGPPERLMRHFILLLEVIAMKKLFAVLAAVAVFAFASQAMAAFELGNFHLIAYEEADRNSLPVGTVGNEVHFDLGAGLFDLSSPIDTGISLDDFGVSSWDQIYVGIAGGGYTPSFGNDRAYFSSDTDDFTVSTGTYSQFQTASLNISSLGGGTNATDSKQIQAKASGSWYANMILSGSAAGTYASLVNASSPFGAEAEMNGGLVSAAIYSFDGFDTNTLTKDLDLFFDTSGDTLVVSQVPVPAAVWLLGSGLLALIGIRRKNS
jgi:hypothetical protein